MSDEIIFEQLYDFQNLRNQLPSGNSSTSANNTKSSVAMPMIGVTSAASVRQRSLLNETTSFQLPLIEKTQNRPLSRTTISRMNHKPLESLPKKYRRSQSALQCQSSVKFEEEPVATQRDERLSEPSASNFNNDQIRQRSYTSYRLIIHRGFIQEQTDQYKQFERTHTSDWPAISKILRRLEKLFYEFAVPIGIIDGERVVELARHRDDQSRPTDEEILSTILNREDIDRYIVLSTDVKHHVRTRVYTDHDRFQAAVCIQKYWRSYLSRRQYLVIQQKRQKAARIILTACFRYMKMKRIRNQIKENQQRCLLSYQRNQDLLKDNWTQISLNRRVIVHLPSLGLPQSVREQLGNIPLKENFQIGRLCDLQDPNVELIYISPIPITDDISQYYYKLISLRAMVEQGNEQVSQSVINQFQERLTIVVPETLKLYPFENLCLSTQLRYSPSALKQVKALINNRPGYLISSFPHVDDLFIADYLNLPIYGCEPELSYLYSTKSGSKRIFRTSNVPMPFGEYDIYNHRQLLQSLATLIVDHHEIDRWLFKIDDYIDGLGVAYCDVKKYLSTVIDDKSLSKTFLIETIIGELDEILRQHTIFVNDQQFKDWSSYLNVFLSHGGVIEAFPQSDLIRTLTVCLSIEPNGHHTIVCSSNQYQIESMFSSWAYSFPQTIMDPSKLNEISHRIIDQCQQRNIYGDVEFDVLVFNDRITNDPQYWLIDLSIGYSETRAMFNLLTYLTLAKFDQIQHSIVARTKEYKKRLRNWQNGAPEQKIVEQQFQVIATCKLRHQNLSLMSYSEFFKFCREKSVGFDIRKRRGTVFSLLQEDHHEYLGLMTIADRLETSESNFVHVLKELHRELTDEGKNNFKQAIEHIEQTIRYNKTPPNAS